MKLIKKTVHETPTADIPQEDAAMAEFFSGLLKELQDALGAPMEKNAERLRTKAGLPAPTEAQRAETTNVLRDQIRDRILKALSGDVAVKKNADGTPDPDDVGVSLLAAGTMRKSRLSMGGRNGLIIRLAKEGFGEKEGK